MRLFVALSLDDQIKRRMVQTCERIDVGEARVRWCRADQLHMTLKFIGEVDDDLVKPICAAVQRVADDTPPFELEISGTGCFPPGGAVRIVWVGGADPSKTLHQAVQRIEEELALLGIAKEKRTFSEHFTVGRVKFDPSRGTLRESVLAVGFACCRQSVSELVVYQSTLARTGAQYTPVLRARLNG